MDAANLDAASFAAMVDHTLLKPEATREQIVRICDEAISLSTAAVCVNSYWLSTVHQRLAGGTVRTCSVVGFPLGAMSTGAVVTETEIAVAEGADEIDMVVPVGLVRSGETTAAQDYIAAVRAACADRTLKVILETAILTPDEIRRSCAIAEQAGADFVKTSTGFNPAGGATVDTVALLRECVGDRMGVKASGGIRDLADVRRMIDAGASRLGMSATVAVVGELSPDEMSDD